MVVNFRLPILILGCIFFHNSYSDNQQSISIEKLNDKYEIEKIETIQFAYYTVKDASVIYENKLMECWNSEKPLTFSQSDLSKFTRDEFLTAIGGLYGANKFSCSKLEALEFAHAYENLRYLYRDFNVNPPQYFVELNELYMSTTFHSGTLISQAKYSKLDNHVKVYFENLIGDQPFKLVETIDKYYEQSFTP